MKLAIQMLQEEAIQATIWELNLLDSLAWPKIKYSVSEFCCSESNLLASAGHRNRQPQQQQLYYLRRYDNPDAEKAKRFSDGGNVAQR